MKLLLLLSWRSLWRNSRRTVITILAITFATLSSIAMRGVQLGTYEENISFALRLFPGFIQLQPPGYLDAPSLRKSFTFTAATRRIIEQTAGVTGYAPRVSAEGLASFGGTSLGAALLGVVPAREKSVCTITSRINSGSFFRSDTTTDAVVGATLLKNLGASVGDDIVILAQSYDGSLGNMKCRIVGTVNTGSADLDQSAVFMGLSTLQNLVGMEGRVQVVALALDRTYDVPAAMAGLNASLDTTRIRPVAWQQILPDLHQSIQLDNISGIIFLAILVVVVAFGILNTILMSVTERFREFGVLLSLGMPSGMLAAVVALETALIIVLGIAAGNALGLGVNTYLIAHPIELGGGYKALMEQYGFLPVITSSLRSAAFVNTTVSLVAASVLSSIYPLYKTFTLEPLKGVRYT